MQNYKIVVHPLYEREQLIKLRCSAPLGKFTTYEVYEGKSIELDKIMLPIDMPIYRISNGRTQTSQMAVISDKSLASDYFSAGEENETVQNLQHQILWQFAKDGSESITPITEVLERDGQIEPILITPRGVVVNGNRRLAAMRELGIQQVECAVLPSLTPNEILDIEVRLQMRPETKLDYGWVDECLMIQRLIKSGKKEDAIVHLLRQRPKDIKNAISALKEADIYLTDWLKKPGDYRQVKNSEQFFFDLPTRLKNKNGELLEASRRIAWMLVQNSSELGRRLYSFNKIFGDKAPEVLERLAQRIEFEPPPTIESGATKDEDLEIDIDLGALSSSDQKYSSLISLFDDPDKRMELFEELKAVCQTILDAGKSEEKGKQALENIRDANTRLAEVDLTIANSDTYNAIEKQLEEVLRKVHALQLKVKTIKENTPDRKTA